MVKPLVSSLKQYMILESHHVNLLRTFGFLASSENVSPQLWKSHMELNMLWEWQSVFVS